MKIYTVVVLALLAVVFSSCYARVRTYNDGFESYRYRRAHYDKHNYERDQTYRYKESYYRNHRDGSAFR